MRSLLQYRAIHPDAKSQWLLETYILLQPHAHICTWLENDCEYVWVASLTSMWIKKQRDYQHISKEVRFSFPFCRRRGAGVMTSDTSALARLAAQWPTERCECVCVHAAAAGQLHPCSQTNLLRLISFSSPFNRHASSHSTGSRIRKTTIKFARCVTQKN
jgi:hypothetical protein